MQVFSTMFFESQRRLTPSHCGRAVRKRQPLEQTHEYVPAYQPFRPPQPQCSTHSSMPLANHIPLSLRPPNHYRLNLIQELRLCEKCYPYQRARRPMLTHEFDVELSPSRIRHVLRADNILCDFHDALGTESELFETMPEVTESGTYLACKILGGAAVRFATNLPRDGELFCHCLKGRKRCGCMLGEGRGCCWG